MTFIINVFFKTGTHSHSIGPFDHQAEAEAYAEQYLEKVLGKESGARCVVEQLADPDPLDE